MAASTRAFPSPPCQAPAELTRSELENAFLVIAERHNLPRPRVGVGLGGYTADFLWPEAKLIVETDGLDAHGTTRAFEHDRRRDRRLLEMGYRTVRLTGRALELDGAAVARQLRAILAQPQAGASAGSRSRSSSKPPSRASSSSASAR